MKKHINEKHADEEYLTIRHGKLDRKNSEYVKETNYEKNDLKQKMIKFKNETKLKKIT